MTESATRAPSIADAGLVISWQLPFAMMDELIDEAASQSFKRQFSTAYGAKSNDRRITSPFNMASVPGGAAARKVGELTAAREALSRVTQLEPRYNVATYVLYTPGSYLGLHTDRPGCDLNLLVLLAGEPTSFEYFPSLVEASAESLFELATTNNAFLPDGTHADLLDKGDAVAFIGSRLPHQRRPVHDVKLMLSLCYEY